MTVLISSSLINLVPLLSDVIEVDAKTHQDGDARRRILFAAERLQQIAQAPIFLKTH